MRPRRGTAGPAATAPALMAILTIARLTVAEARRRRIIWVLLALTRAQRRPDDVGLRAARVAGPRGRRSNELEIQVGVSQILILVAFMFSFVLAMTAAFLGAPAIAADLESGVAHAMLARPIRRADLVVGRWLGLVAIVSAYAAASGLLEIATVGFVSGYTPPEPLLAVAFLSAQAIVLLTFAMLLSTRLPAIASGAVVRGPVRARLDGRRVRRDRPVLRCRAARRRRRGVALAAAERRPVARDDLQPRAAGGRARRAGPRPARPPRPTRSSRSRRRRRRSSPGRSPGSCWCSRPPRSRSGAATCKGALTSSTPRRPGSMRIATALWRPST